MEFLSRRPDLCLVSIMAQAFSFYSMHESHDSSNSLGSFFHSIITEGTNKCLFRIFSFLQDNYNSFQPRRKIFWYFRS